MVGGLGAVAAARTLVDGEGASARALIDELVEVNWTEANITRARLLPIVARVAVRAGDTEAAQRLGGGMTTDVPSSRAALLTRDATVLEAIERHEEAASTYAAALVAWEALGMRPEIAFARLGRGRTLRSLGRRDEAADDLAQARSIFEDLSAAPAIAEIDRLLSESGSGKKR